MLKWVSIPVQPAAVVFCCSSSVAAETVSGCCSMLLAKCPRPRSPHKVKPEEKGNATNPSNNLTPLPPPANSRSTRGEPRRVSINHPDVPELVKVAPNEFPSLRFDPKRWWRKVIFPIGRCHLCTFLGTPAAVCLLTAPTTNVLLLHRRRPQPTFPASNFLCENATSNERSQCTFARTSQTRDRHS